MPKSITLIKLLYTLLFCCLRIMAIKLSSFCWNTIRTLPKFQLWTLYMMNNWILMKILVSVICWCLCWAPPFYYMMLQRFLCGGRLIFGPDVLSLFFSLLMVAGPAITFCIKVHNIINHNKQNQKQFSYWYGVLIVAATLTCLVSNW